MTFSLVLPTYNVAKYIISCLESCCQQDGMSPADYEIVIVNDETPDNSMEMAKKVINKYPNHNWKVVNRKNGGLSAARNSGISAANGDYIWFIDSDDYIDGSALAILAKVIANNDYDIVNFTHKTIYKNGRTEGGNLHFDGFTTSGVDYLARHDFLSAWTLVYKRDFIIRNNLRFKEGVIWEDSEFNIRAYLLTDRCYCISNPLYYYIRRENSISDSKATVFSTQSRISNVIGLNKFLDSDKFTNYKLKVAYSQMASILIFAMAGLTELNLSSRKKFRKDIRNEGRLLWKLICKCNSKTKKLILLSYYLFPQISEVFLNRRIHRAITR